MIHYLYLTNSLYIKHYLYFSIFEIFNLLMDLLSHINLSMRMYIRKLVCGCNCELIEQLIVNLLHFVDKCFLSDIIFIIFYISFSFNCCLFWKIFLCHLLFILHFCFLLCLTVYVVFYLYICFVNLFVSVSSHPA